MPASGERHGSHNPPSSAVCLGRGCSGRRSACLGLWSAGVRAEPAAAPPPAARRQRRSAAESPAPAPPAAADKGRESLENKADPVSIGRVLLEKTNWLGWMFYAAEGTLSVMALTITLERLFTLRRRKLMPSRFVRRLRDLIARREDTPENLLTLCEGSESPMANVLRGGVLRAGRPLPEVEKALEDAVLRESNAQRGRNRMLSVIASVAPMVGLLGTVVGMILAFRVTSQAGTGKAELPGRGHLPGPVADRLRPGDRRAVAAFWLTGSIAGSTATFAT